jgi:hypothetical protein
MEPSLSPDGTVRIEWEEFDGRMSHVICSPVVKWAATGEVILFMGSDWDGALKWLGSGNTFHIYFRRYASGGDINVVIEPSAGVFRIGDENGEPEPLANARERLTEEIDKKVRRAPGVPLVDTRLSLLEWFGVVVLAAGLIFVAVDWMKKLSALEKPRKEPPKIIREIPKPTR